MLCQRAPASAKLHLLLNPRLAGEHRAKSLHQTAHAGPAPAVTSTAAEHIGSICRAARVRRTQGLTATLPMPNAIHITVTSEVELFPLAPALTEQQLAASVWVVFLSASADKRGLLYWKTSINVAVHVRKAATLTGYPR